MGSIRYSVHSYVLPHGRSSTRNGAPPSLTEQRRHNPGRAAGLGGYDSFRRSPKAAHEDKRAGPVLLTSVGRCPGCLKMPAPARGHLRTAQNSSSADASKMPAPARGHLRSCHAPRCESSESGPRPGGFHPPCRIATGVAGRVKPIEGPPWRTVGFIRRLDRLRDRTSTQPVGRFQGPQPLACPVVDHPPDNARADVRVHPAGPRADNAEVKHILRRQKSRSGSQPDSPSLSG